MSHTLYTLSHLSMSSLFFLTNPKLLQYKSKCVIQRRAKHHFTMLYHYTHFTSTIRIFHLIEEQFSTLLLPQVHLFDCHLAASCSLRSDAHDACWAFTDLDEIVEVFPWVSWTDDHLEGCTELKHRPWGHWKQPRQCTPLQYSRSIKRYNR